MERIIFILVLTILIFSNGVCNAEQAQQTTNTIPPTVPQIVGFNLCSKIYPIKSEKLFCETLSAISANKFTIKEIQSRSGYIIFSCGNKNFIATIASVDETHSIIKISPCDNNYFFPTGIITNIYKYLDMSFNVSS